MSGKRASAVALVVVFTGTALGAIVAGGANAQPGGVGQTTREEVLPTPSGNATRGSGVLLQSEIQKVAVSPSGASRDSQRANSSSRVAPKPTPAKKTVRAQSQRTVTVTTIRSYRDCTGFAQKCIDQGYLTKYNPGRPTLAGHNYMGYQWMSRLPVGRVVKITSGSLRGTYRVYDHAWSKRARQGGKFPSKAYGADVVLQTCEPNGTGFSLLRRV